MQENRLLIGNIIYIQCSKTQKKETQQRGLFRNISKQHRKFFLDEICFAFTQMLVFLWLVLKYKKNSLFYQ